MKYKFFILIMLCNGLRSAIPGEIIQSVAACNVAQSAQPISLGSEVNFDELEDLALGCNAFEKAEFSKPSKILILLRIVGMPLFNAYLKMTDSMTKFSTWLSSIFKKNIAYESRQ